MFKFKSKRIIYLFILISNFHVTSAFSSNHEKDKEIFLLDNKISFLECINGHFKDDLKNSNDFLDRMEKVCNLALKTETNPIRKAVIYSAMGEYRWNYEFDIKIDNFNKKSILKSIDEYRKSNKLAKSIKEKDIKNYNLNKPYPDAPNFKEAFLDAHKMKIILQSNHFSIGKAYTRLGMHNEAIKSLKKSIKYHVKNDEISNLYYADSISWMNFNYSDLNNFIEVKKNMELIINDNKCIYTKQNCINNKINLANTFFALKQYEYAFNTLENVNIENDYDGEISNSDEYLCTLITNVEYNKLIYAEVTGNTSSNPKHIDFIKGCKIGNNYDQLDLLAKFERSKGNYEKSIYYHEKAKNFIINSQLINEPIGLLEIADLNLSLSKTYYKLGEIEKNISLIKQALDIYESSQIQNIPRKVNLDKLWYGSYLLAEDIAQKNKAIKAIKYLKEGIKYEINYRQKIVPFLSIKERLEVNKKDSFMSYYNALFSLPVHLKNNNLKNVEGFKLPLFARINFQGLNEDIEMKQNLIVNSSPENKVIFEQIKFLESKISNRNFINKKLNDVSQLEIKLNKLENKLYQALPEIKPRIFSVKEISDLLPSESLLIEFQQYDVSEGNVVFKEKEPRYSLTILKPDEEVISIDLGNASEINEIIKSLSENIIQGNQSLIEESLAKIYLKIFEPINQYLTNVKTIYISPDSSINLIPFNIIKIPKIEKYISEFYEINLVANARELFNILNKEKVENNNKSVVFSNPDFYLDEVKVVENIDLENKYLRIGNSCKTWNYLEGTIEEGNQIKKLINAKLFTDKEATVNNLKSLDSPPKILHMATHGYFCEDKQFSRHPLVKSGIVLAGANNLDNEGDDDGYLTSLEAAKLNLKNTELVVLSACNTALGDIETGNGVLGLRRALSVAGARSTLLSLWAVDDFATRAFMTSFYQKLKAGNNLRDSLIMTQQDFRNGVIKSDDPYIDWSEEFYWGAFQLSGDSSATLFN